MSVATSPRGPESAVGQPADLAARLRHPHETRTFIVSVLAMLVIFAGAIFLIDTAAGWLGGHPVIADAAEHIRVLAIVAIVALPLTRLLRLLRLFAKRGNGIQISRTQAPELHGLLLDVCRRLGVQPVPELFVAKGGDRLAEAYAVLDRRACVVLGREMFDREPTLNVDCMRFAIGSAVGSLRLGHKRWWVELLTTYVAQVPILRTPLVSVMTYSQDRCGAFVEPHGARALMIEAAGKDLLGNLDVPSFVRQVDEYGGIWARISESVTGRPHISRRAKMLYAAGFLDRARDLAS